MAAGLNLAIGFIFRGGAFTFLDLLDVSHWQKETMVENDTKRNELEPALFWAVKFHKRFPV